MLSLQGGMGPDADPDGDVVLQAPPDTASPQRRQAQPTADTQRQSYSQQQQQILPQEQQQQQQHVVMTDVTRPYPGGATAGPVEMRSWVGVLVRT